MVRAPGPVTLPLGPAVRPQPESERKRRAATATAQKECKQIGTTLWPRDAFPLWGPQISPMLLILRAFRCIFTTPCSFFGRVLRGILRPEGVEKHLLRGRKKGQVQYLSFNRPKGQAADFMIRRSGIQIEDLKRRKVEVGCRLPEVSGYFLGWQDSTYRRIIPSLMSLRTFRSAATSLMTARYSFPHERSCSSPLSLPAIESRATLT